MKAHSARVRALQKAFAWNGGYREYFAVKANPNPRIVQILREEGCGADCSSLTELMLAQALGFSGEEIMFSSNMTPANEFEYARSLNAIINWTISRILIFCAGMVEFRNAFACGTILAARCNLVRL